MSVESRILWTEPEQRVLIGDCREGLRSLPEKSVQFCCCSPPYWSQRLYGTSPQKWSEGDWTGELGNEPTPQLFIAHLCEVFSEIWRVLWCRVRFSTRSAGVAPLWLSPRLTAGAESPANSIRNIFH